MTHKLWGTRFARKTNKLTEKFTSSISFDQRLAKYDILGSIAHAKMLGKQKIIPLKDSREIVKGLNTLLKEVASGKFKFDVCAEDIHSNIQESLVRKIGKPAHKLHTARSRNDQVALDIRIYLKSEVDNLVEYISQLQKSILKLASKLTGNYAGLYASTGCPACALESPPLKLYRGPREGQRKNPRCQKED